MGKADVITSLLDLCRIPHAIGVVILKWLCLSYRRIEMSNIELHIIHQILWFRNVNGASVSMLFLHKVALAVYDSVFRKLSQIIAMLGF